MTGLDLDAIEARANAGVRRTTADADVLALVARVRELEDEAREDVGVIKALRRQRDTAEQKVATIAETASIIHAHRFDADRRDDPDHAAWLASFGETPAKRPDMFYAGVEYAVKRMNAALTGGGQ